MKAFSLQNPETRNPSISAEQHIEFDITGEIEVSWKGEHTLHMERARISIVEQGDTVSDIVLEADFDRFSAMKLSHDFPPLQAVADGVTSYAFSMLPEARARYQAEFSQAILLEDWLSIGNGAIMQLEHYACIGRARFDEQD